MQGQKTNSASGSPRNAEGVRLLKAAKQKGRGRFADLKLGSIRELDVAIIAAGSICNGVMLKQTELPELQASGSTATGLLPTGKGSWAAASGGVYPLDILS